MFIRRRQGKKKYYFRGDFFIQWATIKETIKRAYVAWCWAFHSDLFQLSISFLFSLPILIIFLHHAVVSSKWFAASRWESFVHENNFDQSSKNIATTKAKRAKTWALNLEMIDATTRDENFFFPSFCRWPWNAVLVVKCWSDDEFK